MKKHIWIDCRNKKEGDKLYRILMGLAGKRTMIVYPIQRYRHSVSFGLDGEKSRYGRKTV